MEHDSFYRSNKNFVLNVLGLNLYEGDKSMLKPVKKINVTRKVIKSKINELNIIDKNKEDIFNATIAALKHKRVLLKELNNIIYTLVKKDLEISVYTKDRYFGIDWHYYKDK